MTDQPSFAEYINSELMRSYTETVEANMPCLLCGQFLAGHDQAACDAKMATWQPTGLLSETDLIKTFGYVEVPHELLVDSGGHVCGPDCPPEPDPLPPLPRRTRVRYALRRARWRMARVGGLRLVHKDRIDQDRDD